MKNQRVYKVDKSAKEIIMKEGFIILSFIIFYAICLLAAFVFPYALTLEVACISIIATVVFIYLLYLIARFIRWVNKVLKEK